MLTGFFGIANHIKGQAGRVGAMIWYFVCSLRAASLGGLPSLALKLSSLQQPSVLQAFHVVVSRKMEKASSFDNSSPFFFLEEVILQQNLSCFLLQRSLPYSHLSYGRHQEAICFTYIFSQEIQERNIQGIHNLFLTHYYN